MSNGRPTPAPNNQQDAQYRAAMVHSQQEQQLRAMQMQQRPMPNAGQQQQGANRLSQQVGMTLITPPGLQQMTVAALYQMAREGSLTQEQLGFLRTFLTTHSAMGSQANVRPPNQPQPATGGQAGPQTGQQSAASQVPRIGLTPHEAKIQQAFAQEAEKITAKIQEFRQQLKPAAEGGLPPGPQRTNAEKLLVEEQGNLQRWHQKYLQARKMFESNAAARAAGAASANASPRGTGSPATSRAGSISSPAGRAASATGSAGLVPSNAMATTSSFLSSSSTVPSKLSVSNSTPEPYPNANGPRPSLSQGLGASPLIRTPAILQRPSLGSQSAIDWGQLMDANDAARKADADDSSKLLSKRKIQELVETIDPNEHLDGDVEDLLLDIADEFIESVTQFACRLAKHRKGDKLEVRDVQLHLERNWNIRVPFPGSMPLAPPRQTRRGGGGGGAAAAAS